MQQKNFFDRNNTQIKKGDYVVWRLPSGGYEVLRVVIIKRSWFLQTVIGKYNNNMEALRSEELLIVDY